MTAADLAARIEAADESQTWELLADIWDFLCKNDMALRRFACSCIDARGTTNAGRFAKLHDANAPYDAAMMLLPARFTEVTTRRLHDGTGYCFLFDPVTGEDVFSEAKSDVLAIAAAAVRRGDECLFHKRSAFPKATGRTGHGRKSNYVSRSNWLQFPIPKRRS